ncbi:hypothetical protein K9L16_00030 [Candidatus Pacearchaeota archaeon]|nr:hypothetical protein [Candidatus Pacearchaeota archaeon]
MEKKKAVVLYSDGLDSRLAAKIMQEQGFDVILFYIKLPFSKNCEKNTREFSHKNNFKLKILDCTKGDLFIEYLKSIKKPKFPRGKGFNPCIDCKIFMFNKVKEFASKNNIELIVTGEVLDERPLSQSKKALELIEKNSGLAGRVLRPLSAKLLPETNAEKKALIDKNKLFAIQGRQRNKQFSLAKKFKINYPQPSGGCLLCEIKLKKRFKIHISDFQNPEISKLSNIGRHFLINEYYVVLGRNEKENKIILDIVKNGKVLIPDFPAPTIAIFSKKTSGKIFEIQEKIQEKVLELRDAYSKKGSLESRRKFERYLL